MAKSKTKRARTSKQQSTIDWGGPAASSTSYVNYALAALTLAILLGGAAYWWMGRAAQGDFDTLVVAGQAALAQVESFPNDGRTHLNAGEHHSYATSFPTSGPHDPYPTAAGVYASPQRPTKLVHSLEHGNIVFYYDKPAAEIMAQLEDWARLYTGTWDGIVITPLPGLGSGIVATAWQKKLSLTHFDPAAAAAFVDAYRGRGPENPVR